MSAKRNTYGYCNAYISHCANYYFINEDKVNLAQVTKAQADNYRCIQNALKHFTVAEVGVLRSIFTSGLPLVEAMRVLHCNSADSWGLLRKFIKVAADYRGLI